MSPLGPHSQRNRLARSKPASCTCRSTETGGRASPRGRRLRSILRTISRNVGGLGRSTSVSVISGAGWSANCGCNVQMKLRVSSSASAIRARHWSPSSDAAARIGAETARRSATKHSSKTNGKGRDAIARAAAARNASSTREVSARIAAIASPIIALSVAGPDRAMRSTSWRQRTAASWRSADGCRSTVCNRSSKRSEMCQSFLRADLNRSSPSRHRR